MSSPVTLPGPAGESRAPSSVLAAGLDAAFVRQLPYHFARARGCIAARKVDDTVELWVRPGVTAAAIGEARRALGAPVRTLMLSPELFERRLAQLYSTGDAGSAQLMDDMSDAVDLQSLAAGLPRVTDLLETEDDAPVIRFINVLLTQALRERASDVHIEVFEGRSVVRMRMDGVLRERCGCRRTSRRVVSRVKVMARLDIAERRLPQDGRIALSLGGRLIDVRVSTLPTGRASASCCACSTRSMAGSTSTSSA